MNEQLPLVLMTDLKIIGDRIKRQDGWITDYDAGMLAAYSHVLSALHFTEEAIIKIYADFNID